MVKQWLILKTKEALSSEWIVTGCLGQRYQDEIQKEIPEVDAILGVTSMDKVVDAIEATVKRNKLFSYENYFDDIDKPAILR